MLTVGAVFVIWNVVIAQSVFWLRAVAVPVSVALVVAGLYVASMPFSALVDMGGTRFLTYEADWLSVRRVASAAFVIAGFSMLAIVAFAS